MSDIENPIFCALDLRDLNAAVALANDLRGSIGGIKLGMEFFYTHGGEGYLKVAQAGLPIFLDLKFHDIPNTVAGAVRALLPLEPALLTLHISGGSAMMSAARSAAQDAKTPPALIGVSVLTSLNEDDLGQMGVSGSVQNQVSTLARLAQSAGLDGAVCSPMEIEQLRANCGEKFQLIVPGIRPEGADTQDQKRVMTPRQARDLGANILVIGRPIVQADDPVAAAQDIVKSLG